MPHVSPRFLGQHGQRRQLAVGIGALEVITLRQIEQHNEVRAEAGRSLFRHEVGHLRLRQHITVQLDKTSILHVFFHHRLHRFHRFHAAANL